MEYPQIRISAGTIIKTIIIGLLFYSAYILKNLLLVVLMAIVIASSIEPLTKWFMRRGVPRLLSVIMIYLFLASGLAFTVFFLLLPLLGESSQVLKTLPTYFSSESAQTTNFLSNQPFVSGLTDAINIDQIVAQINSVITSLSAGAFNTVASVFGGIISFLLMVVLSFYLSVEDNGVGKFLKIITPLKHEKYVLDLWRRSQMKIGLWMQGQLVLGVVIATLVYLGLTLLNIPNALLLAFLAGVFEIIPLFGPILAAIPAIALSFASGGLSNVALVAGLYLVIHQFENHLIYPLVVKNVTGMPPVVSIIALAAGWELLGFLGLILSVPLTMALIEFFDDLEKDKIAMIEGTR